MIKNSFIYMMVCLVNVLLMSTSAVVNNSNSNIFPSEQEYLHFSGSNDKCTVVGDNDEYVLVIMYPWNNTPEEIEKGNGMIANGYSSSGLYTNNEDKEIIYRLPELNALYNIQVSFNGEEVWFVADQLVPLSAWHEGNGTMPMIAYYNNGKKYMTSR